MTTAAPSLSWRRDLRITLLALVLIVLWDVSGGDWIVSSHYGQADGFAAHHAAWAVALYNAGRGLALAAWVALIVWAAWPGRATGARVTTLIAALSVLIAALLVAIVKRASGADCPWSLQAFGGAQPYLSHWTNWSPSAGAGGCFPSGHASAGFAFLAVYALWRTEHRRLAQIVLWATLALGMAYGGLQVVRGAHFASHVLWSAWLCWLVALLSPLLLRWTPWRVRTPQHGPPLSISR